MCHPVRRQSHPNARAITPDSYDDHLFCTLQRPGHSSTVGVASRRSRRSSMRLYCAKAASTSSRSTQRDSYMPSGVDLPQSSCTAPPRSPSGRSSLNEPDPTEPELRSRTDRARPISCAVADGDVALRGPRRMADDSNRRTRPGRHLSQGALTSRSSGRVPSSRPSVKARYRAARWIRPPRRA